jgi:hypothetical protein
MRGLVEDAISINARDIGKALPDIAEFGLVELEISGLGIQEVEIVSTPGYFGGLLRWFICPRCNRRVGILYLPGREEAFLCRQCHRLGYRQQLLRAFRKTENDQKIKSKRNKKGDQELNILKTLIDLLKAENEKEQDKLG